MANNHQEANKNQRGGKQNQNDQTKKMSPAIVERVSKYPIINMALNIGYSQYARLKTSNVTVGELMTKAESIAMYLWNRVQPLAERLQEPISKADKFACNTLDFVEEKLHQANALRTQAAH